MRFGRGTRGRPQADDVERDGPSDEEREWEERYQLLSSELHGLRQAAAFEDPVTGLGNERQFARDTSKIAARFRRRGTPFAILLLDVRVARAPETPLLPQLTAGIADRLKATAREEDGIFLLDSALFAVLVVDSGLEGAERLLDRIRFALTTTPMECEEGLVYVTAAGGLAEASSDFASVDEMVAAAHDDLTRYEADLGRQHDWFRPNAA